MEFHSPGLSPVLEPQGLETGGPSACIQGLKEKCVSLPLLRLVSMVIYSELGRRWVLNVCLLGMEIAEFLEWRESSTK